MPTGGSLRRSVAPQASGTAAVVPPRAMDATKDAVSFLGAVLAGSLVIIVVGLVGILLS